MTMTTALIGVVACQSTPSRKISETSVTEILEQVNSSIVEAKKRNSGEVPVIKSIQLELQLGTDTDIRAQGSSILMVAPSGDAVQENMHRISLTFIPRDSSSTVVAYQTAVTNKNPELTNAISTIYKSVQNANPGYEFVKGAVQIQCTLNESIESGDNRLRLIPIQFNASESRESIQTIVLNFAGKGVTDVTPSSPSPLVTDALAIPASR